jgi:hypothetical protein
MAQLGKALIILGIVIAAAGVFIWGAGSIPIFNRLGRMPGDIYIHRGNLSFYFPITTAIIVSIAVSILLALLRR